MDDADASCGADIGEDSARTGEFAGVGWRDRCSSSSGIGDGIGTYGLAGLSLSWSSRSLLLDLSPSLSDAFDGGVTVAALAVDEPETDAPETDAVEDVAGGFVSTLSSPTLLGEYAG